MGRGRNVQMNFHPEIPMQPMQRPSFPVRIFVGQIPKQWNEDEVQKYFERFYPIQEVRVSRDTQGVPKGSALVTVASIAEGHVLIQALNENFFLPGVI